MNVLDFLTFLQLGFLAEQNSRLVFLAMGIATFSAGVLMLLSHKRSVDAAFADKFRSDAFRRMENRKYLRRSATSSMIAMIGALIAGCYFVTDSWVAIGFFLAIVVLVLMVGTLAMVDFFSVGFQQIVSGDRQAEKEILEEIVRRHEQEKSRSDAPHVGNVDEPPA